MQITTVSFILSIASFGLSGVLGWLKIKEYRRDNRAISVNRHLNGNPDTGDTIFLTNLSTTPILVDYWEVGWLKRTGLKKQFTPLYLFADDDLHLTLEPRKRVALNFKNEYINWSPKSGDKGKFYIKLYIAGRKKPLLLFVHDPHNP